MRPVDQAEPLRSLGNPLFPIIRRMLFILLRLTVLPGHLSAAQTPSIGLVVNGLGDPNHRFSPP